MVKARRLKHTKQLPHRVLGVARAIPHQFLGMGLQNASKQNDQKDFAHDFK
jgi:hypothetical protein